MSTPPSPSPADRLAVALGTARPPEEPRADDEGAVEVAPSEE